MTPRHPGIAAIPSARLLIDGAFVDTATRAPIVDPATGQQLGTAPEADSCHLGEALRAARGAFDHTTWSTDHQFRRHCLEQLHHALVEQGPAMRALTTAEAGAPDFLTAGPQYDVPVEGLSWVGSMLETYPWETDLGVAAPMGIASQRWLRREASGVVAAITPWNFPNQINLAKVGPALAAGNTVVLKPAPDTPWLACELGRIVAEHTDIPPGVFNVIATSDNTVAESMVAAPEVDVVSFTGATETGRRVMAAAAPGLKRVFLELGGKSAAVVLDDADLATAASTAAFAACIHAGQGCAITTRLLVPHDKYDEAVEIAAATMASIGPGDPRDPGTICGPVISRRQRDRVESYLRLAEAEGGSFATGGDVHEAPGDLAGGWWIQPTVIAGLDNTARVAREEIFGPVLAVIAHHGDDHAVALANDSDYGLSGSVSAGSIERARAVANRIRTGSLSVNGGLWFSPDAPFGGYKQSGLGREMGVLGFEEYLETKVIAEPAQQ